jgi:hypothetical protein
MGMYYPTDGSTQDEIARIFQQRVKRGEFVEVGKDRDGSPLYQLAETLAAPLRGLQVLLTADIRTAPLNFTIKPSRS